MANKRRKCPVRRLFSELLIPQWIALWRMKLHQFSRWTRNHERKPLVYEESCRMQQSKDDYGYFVITQIHRIFRLFFSIIVHLPGLEIIPALYRLKCAKRWAMLLVCWSTLWRRLHEQSLDSPQNHSKNLEHTSKGCLHGDFAGV